MAWPQAPYPLLASRPPPMAHPVSISAYTESSPDQQRTFLANDRWLQFVRQETAQPASRLDRPIISPVPPSLFQVRPHAYLPRKIAIGLSNVNTNLAPSPAYQYKTLCLQTLMNHTRKPLDYLMGCIDSNDNISQLLLLASPGYDIVTLQFLLTADCASILDIIGFIDTGMLQDITRFEFVLDLFLVNNQVPLFCIKNLAALLDPNLTKLSGCLDSCSRIGNPFRLRDVEAHNPVGVTKEENGKSMLECQHLLDYLYTACVGQSDINGQFETVIRIPRASELRKVGVKFKVAEGRSPGAVSYTRYVLSLPKLTVVDETEALLRNLLAYEVTSENARDVCAYSVFMDSLIDTAEDVAVLRKAGVLENHLGNDERMRRMWNDMCVNVPTVFSQRWHKMAKEIERDYNSKWNQMYVEFYNLFLSRPWLWLSTIAAVALLLMTASQTFYSVSSYYKA